MIIYPIFGLQFHLVQDQCTATTRVTVSAEGLTVGGVVPSGDPLDIRLWEIAQELRGLVVEQRRIHGWWPPGFGAETI